MNSGDSRARYGSDVMAEMLRMLDIEYAAAFIEDSDDFHSDYSPIVNYIEERLCENYHYKHARQISQLSGVRLFLISGSARDQYSKHLAKIGQKYGDIKFLALRNEMNWHKIFKGSFSV